MKSRCLGLSVSLVVFGLPSLLAQRTEGSTEERTLPRLVRFSGTLADAPETRPNTVAGIAFALYKEEHGGLPLWQEIQNVQLDANVNYSVLLGATKSDGLPAELFASNEARWLGVQPAGQPEQPRVLLLSVPYALKAADAETLGGKPLSAFQLVTPQSSNGSAAKQQNATPAADQPNEIACASGTACKSAFIPLFTTNGGSAKVSDSIISQSGNTLNITGNLSMSSGNLSLNEVDGQFGFFKGSNTGDILTAINTNGLAIAGDGDGSSGVGIEGNAGSTSGKTFGVIGQSASPNGTGLWGLGQGQSVIGQNVGCCGPVGVWGDTSSNAFGAAGLVGTADDGFALVLENNSADHLTAAITNDTKAPGVAILTVLAKFFNQFCNINTNGHLFCTGGTNIVVPVDNSQRQVALHAVESPENWFEDFGSGHLESGVGRIALESTFAQTVNTASDYHVFLTPRGECRGLYISNTSATGFEVHELGGGRSNVAFDYRIVALRRGYENMRLEDETAMVAKVKENVPKPSAIPAKRWTPPVRPKPFTASVIPPNQSAVVPTKSASGLSSH